MVQTRKCQTGYFFRKTYTRTLKNGTIKRIKGKCIRSQSPYTSPLKPNHTGMRGYKFTNRSLKTCPKGFIKRNAYIRKTMKGKRVRVPEQCIVDRGLPGKETRDGGIGPLRKGELSKHGYQHVSNLSVDQRRIALRKAIHEFGSLGVWRKLNAVAVYTKHTSPQISKIFKTDMDWIRREFGIKAF